MVGLAGGEIVVEDGEAFLRKGLDEEKAADIVW
jgi:hypothetical protein